MVVPLPDCKDIVSRAVRCCRNSFNTVSGVDAIIISSSDCEGIVSCAVEFSEILYLFLFSPRDECERSSFAAELVLGATVAFCPRQDDACEETERETRCLSHPQKYPSL